ncbi:MAG: YybS family protein [Deferribacteraceae bacterium]|jgi:hypothetical protein|nr:YybS family protein [Deferribacteraceae bacterium]
MLNMIGMAVSVGVLIAPYALLHSLDTHSRTKFIILALTLACAVLFWPLALYFLLAAIVPAFIMWRLHQNKPADATHWLPIAIAPLPAFAAILVLLALFANELSTLSSEALDELYAYGTNVPSMGLPTRDKLGEAIASTIRISPALVYVSVALVFYFTERAYYAPQDREARSRIIMPMSDLFIGLLLASVLLLALPYVIGDNTLVSAIGMNGLIIVVTLYFFRGLDIIRFHIARLRLSPFLMAAVYLLVLIYWPMLIAVAVVGFASVYVNIIRHEETKS